MKVSEAAKRLEVSVSLVYALLTSGKLKGTRHGLGRGTWRISEEQLADYLAKAEGRAEPAPHPVTQGGTFTFLNAEKLREAWKGD